MKWYELRVRRMMEIVVGCFLFAVGEILTAVLAIVMSVGAVVLGVLLVPVLLFVSFSTVVVGFVKLFLSLLPDDGGW